MELVLEERSPKGQFDLAFARMRTLPAVEPNVPHDLVDVVHNALDDDRGVGIPRLFKELGKGRLPWLFAFHWRHRAIG